MNRTEAILRDNLAELDIFPSTYDTRVLAAIVTSPIPKSASEISEYLEIPDSKVYPSLKLLEEEGLITVNDHTRPKLFSFDKPETLQNYLREKLSKRHEVENGIMESVLQTAKQLWEPDEFELDNIAQLYRGDEIDNELARHIKLTRNKLFVFLSRDFDHYELLQQYLPQVSHEQFRLNLVVPAGKVDFIREIENSVKGKVRVRRSLWNQNSYIIREDKVMMNMFHSDQDVALLTNDELLVKNIERCWNDPDCCTTTDIVDLKLPEEFKFEKLIFQ